MNNERYVSITIGKTNDRYEKFYLADNSFILEVKDLKTNITTKLIISKLDKNKNPMYRLNMNKNTLENIVLYQKVNAASFRFLLNWISLHLND